MDKFCYGNTTFTTRLRQVSRMNKKISQGVKPLRDRNSSTPSDNKSK